MDYQIGLYDEYEAIQEDIQKAIQEDIQEDYSRKVVVEFLLMRENFSIIDAETKREIIGLKVTETFQDDLCMFLMKERMLVTKEMGAIFPYLKHFIEG